MYVLQRDRIEHAKFRALAQILVDKEKGPEAFDEYRQIHFPWLEKQKNRNKAEHLRLLMQEIKRGGLVIKPLGEKKPMRSRLKTMLRPAAAPGSDARNNQLYKKLGMIVPIK